MTLLPSAATALAAVENEAEIDAETALVVLRSLTRKTAPPVVQECLRTACAEIAFLTSSEGDLEDFEAAENGAGGEEAEVA